MTSKLITSFAAAAVSLVLVACGGGGGSSLSSTPSPEVPPVAPPAASFPTNGVSAIALTGAQGPQDTVADQQGDDGRAPGILERSDYLLLSSSYGEGDNPEFPTFVTETECSGTSCTYSGGSTVNIIDNYGVTPGARAILAKHGITTLLLDETWVESDVESDDDTRLDDEKYGFRAYFAWMDYGAFTIVSSDHRYEDDDYAANETTRHGAAHGELTGSRPTATVTWQGLMVGTPQFGSNKFNVLQGDARLAFDMSDMTIDAAFTDIQDLDLNAAHSTPSIRFDDLPVAGDGTFGGVEGPGYSIQGGLYGPGHAETTGVFEQAGIVGAFGAKRQSTPTPEVPPVAPPVSSFPMDGVSAIALTGAIMPTETADAQHESRAPGIVERADSLLHSRSHGEISNPASPTFASVPQCSGTSCMFPGDPTVYSLSDYGLGGSSAREMLTKHGITTWVDEVTWGEADDDARVDDEDYGFRYYGAWMNDAGFFVLSTDGTYEEDSNTFNLTSRQGVAQGELTGSRPTATATWQGLMVGTPQFGDNKFNVLQGDATLAFDMSSMTIDVAFTDIKDLDLNAAHSTPSVRFDDLPVAGDGTFGGVEGPGYGIQGGFYGSGHAETAGVFEQAGIVGAFGARRQ